MAKALCSCGECNACKRRDYNRRWSAENREHRRAYKSTPEYRAKARAYAAAHREERNARAREYRRENLERARVYDRVKRAISAGRLVREPCEVCGAEKVEAHHDDYDRPLDVRWLCPRHHREHHRQIKQQTEETAA